MIQSGCEKGPETLPVPHPRKWGVTSRVPSGKDTETCEKNHLQQTAQPDTAACGEEGRGLSAFLNSL